MNWSQEARVAVVVGLVAVVFFTGVSVFRNFGKPVTPPSTNTSSNTSSTNKPSSSTTPVVGPADEILNKPFTVSAVAERTFFEVGSSLAEQEKSVVYFDGKYMPNQGIDFVFNDTSFDVKAAASGVVLNKVDDQIFGLTVTVEVEGGVQLVYASLASSTLQVGQKVSQNDLIGQAGHSIYGTAIGKKHLHFEVYKDGKVVNPAKYFGISIDEIQ